MFSVKKRIVLDSVILAGILLAVVSGCDRGARHKVLTFFFEGVPPLDADRQAADTKTPVEESPTVAVASEEPARITRQSPIFPQKVDSFSVMTYSSSAKGG